MIVWHGRGFVIAAVAFGCFLASEYSTEAYFQDETYYQAHGWPKLAGFLTAAAIVWWLQREGEEIPAMDGVGRKPAILRRGDGLFFIPVRYWPPLLGALGVVFYFVPA